MEDYPYFLIARKPGEEYRAVYFGREERIGPGYWAFPTNRVEEGKKHLQKLGYEVVAVRLSPVDNIDYGQLNVSEFFQQWEESHPNRIPKKYNKKKKNLK